MGDLRSLSVSAPDAETLMDRRTKEVER
jgi:hypothetical protein